MAKYGIGASPPRKEDDRFLRGRGQYVGDIRMAGTRDVAFVRSPVAHARLKRINIPEQFRNLVFTAEHLTGVKPIISAPPLKGFKYSVEPILAADKVRYVGEMVAMCLASTRAQAEDIASAVTLELEELPAVTDMLEACQPGSPLVHEEWGDNIFVEFSENGPVDEVAKPAASLSHPHHLDPVSALGSDWPVRVPRAGGRRGPGHFTRRGGRLRL